MADLYYVGWPLAIRVKTGWLGEGVGWCVHVVQQYKDGVGPRLCGNHRTWVGSSFLDCGWTSCWWGWPAWQQVGTIKWHSSENNTEITLDMILFRPNPKRHLLVRQGQGLLSHSGLLALKELKKRDSHWLISGPLSTHCVHCVHFAL